MSRLDGLMRVRRWILDERRQRLSDMEAFADKLRADLAALEGQKNAEGKEAVRHAKLLATIAELEREIGVAREELKATYEDLESVQQAQHSRVTSKFSRRPRREILSGDEREIGYYRRRTATGGSGSS